MTPLKNIFTFSLCLFYYSLTGQTNYYFEPITVNNGLPHQTVYRVLQDKKGFIWFGTQRGLMRYDGYACRLFGQTQAGSVGFEGKPIHALLEDRKGNLWVGTHSGDLCKRDFSTGNFQYLTDTLVFKDLVGKRIQALFEDNSGKIWIGTLDDGLLVFDPQTNKIQHFTTDNSALTNDAIFAFAQEKTGRIWIATAGEGINYVDHTKAMHFKQRYADVPNLNGYKKTLLLDDKNNLWIGSDGTGLYQLKVKMDSIKHFGAQNDGKSINSNAVMGLALNKNSELLIATDGGGLNVFNPETNTFSVYKSDNKSSGNLNTNALYDVCVDAVNNVWVATFNGGVNTHKAHQIRFDYFSYTGKKTNELNNRSVLGLCQTADGAIFIGTDGGGLNVFNRKNNSFSFINNPNKIQNNVVKTIYEDKQKRLWLGYFNGGLALYNPQNQSFKHYLSNPNDHLSISNNSVWSIASDSSGQLWVGTVGNGVNLFNPKTEKFKHFNSNSKDPTSLSHDAIMVVFADKKNNVWIGTEHSGLNLFNREKNNFTRFQHEKKGPLSISSDFIRAVFEDSRGRLWIGTEGGLNLWLGDGKFKHYTTKNGLISDAIMGISEDFKGNLWLSAYEGIARFDTDRDSFQNFKFNNTLDKRSNQFNQSAILRTLEGEILFGGINGLDIIKPELIMQNTNKPRIVFTDFKVFDVSVINGNLDGRLLFKGDINDAKDINLSYKDNAFSIEFAALDFTESSRNQYAFKMEGFDKEWQYNFAEQRLVTYTNLDAGTYFFKVRGTNSSGEWSDNEAVIKIIIAPPFWKTWWFKLLLFLTAIGLSIVAFRFYLTRREMELRQRVLESEQEILSLNNQQLASTQAILNLKNEQLESEQEILSLQNEKLATEIDTKNNELMSKAVQMAHKNELLIGIKDDLEGIKTASETERLKSIKSLTRTLESEIENKESWDQFLLYFNQTHQNFIHALQLKHPNLTQNDLRMCALTRLNMSNREMATLLNITITGIEQSRYRLKKRLNLTVEDDLSRYLTAF
jgi:ligand-binding sensor domain-containing protein/DNA-binding CsgD family transcriptional regulator